MAQIAKQTINELSENNLPLLAELDSCGIFPGTGEKLIDFKSRLLAHAAVLEKFETTLRDSGEYSLFDKLKLYEDDRIGTDIINEAASITGKLYCFTIDWVPGFFLSQSIGWLWAGYAIYIPEEHITVFLIRKSFKRKKKWLIYRREELLAHELCHAARSPLRDRRYEEHFAYQTAPSIIRRYIGNCFRTQTDAVLFLFPVLILLAAQILETFTAFAPPMWLLWIAALAFPFFLLTRNQLGRICYNRAAGALAKIGIVNTAPVLFRCTSDEISAIAKYYKNADGLRQCLDKYINSELRWRIINYRFFSTKS
jgi:hypothetical protein